MFQVDAMSRTPVYEQLKAQLERFILNGTIAEGEQIPSIRNMSIELSINPNTILKAYSELDKMGLIQAVPGKGYFVCENALEVLAQSSLLKLDQLDELISEMAMAGVPREEITRRVDNAYLKERKKGRKEDTND